MEKNTSKSALKQLLRSLKQSYLDKSSSVENSKYTNKLKKLCEKYGGLKNKGDV